jgi:hypothetical protein
MILQLLVGTGLMMLSIIVAGTSFWLMEVMLMHLTPWFLREPHRPKLILALALGALWSMWLTTAGVWVWGIAFRLLGLFPDMEQAIYFSLVAFTTLGFGDVLLPKNWQLLGGMAAANGLLNFGLLVTVMLDALRHVRRSQMEERQRQHPRAARVDALTRRDAAAKSGRPVN